MLKVGETAPAFELPDADMEMVNLSDSKDRHHVVLYFYSRDDTPGCTMEAIDFSDRSDEFARHDTVVMGISRDDCLSHGSFRDKHGLAVRLLSDIEGEVCGRYCVLQEREVDGHRRTGLTRSTFVIDRRGIVRHALYGVNPKGHAAEVLNLVKGLN